MAWANRQLMSNFGGGRDSGMMRQSDMDLRGMNDMMSNNMDRRGMNSRMMSQDNGNHGYSGQNDRHIDSGVRDYDYRPGISGRNQQASPDEFETGIPIHLDKFSGSFDAMTKICGNQGENLDYIEKTSGAKLRLVGRGTGTVDPMTGRSSTEPAQIIISHPEMKGLELTEQLVESLLKSVQEDYQDHLENEYKSMENMLGLEGDARGGNGNMGGMQNNSSMGGQGMMNEPQSRYCSYCDINCGDETLYAIHCKGALHQQKLQDFHERKEANDRSQGQMGRSSGIREPMSMTTKRELEQAFTQLLFRQVQPAYMADLRDRCEYLAQSKPKLNLLPKHPLNRQGFCTVCSKMVTRDVQSHLWSRNHREMYLMLQLNLGLKKFSQEYGDTCVPDMDTNGGRRLATTSLDDYFVGHDALPGNMDPDLYKEVVIRLGYAFKFECRVCRTNLRDEVKWVQHIMSLDHCYKCITSMMDMGVAQFNTQKGDIPCVNAANFQETIKKYFDVEGDSGFGGNWQGPKDSNTVGLGMGEGWSGGGDDTSGRDMFSSSSNFNNQGAMQGNQGAMQGNQGAMQGNQGAMQGNFNNRNQQQDSYGSSFMGDNRMNDNRMGDNRMGDNRMGDNRMGDNRMGDNRMSDNRMGENRRRDRSRSPVGRDSGFMPGDRNMQDEDGSRNGRRSRRSRWNDEDDNLRGASGRGQSSSVPSLLTANLSLPSNPMMTGNMAGTGMRGQAANVGGRGSANTSLVTPNPGRGLLGDGARAMVEFGIAPNAGGQPPTSGPSQMGSINPRMQMSPNSMSHNQMTPNPMSQSPVAQNQLAQQQLMAQQQMIQQQLNQQRMMQMNQMNQMNQMGQMNRMPEQQPAVPPLLSQPLMAPLMQPNNLQSLRAQGAAAIQAVMGTSQEGLSMTDRATVAEVQRLTGIKDCSLVIKALEVLSSLGPGVSQALGSISSINLLVAQLTAVVRPNQKALIQPLVQALNSGSINPQAVISFKGKRDDDDGGRDRRRNRRR